MFCPNASAGLTVCEEDFFDYTQFIWVEYMHSSGGLSCPGSNVRLSYYGMAGLPDIAWDGVERYGGGESSDTDGLVFRNIINDHLTVDSPLAVTVSSFDFSGNEPYITVKIEIFEDLATIADTDIRVGICENGLSYGGDNYDHILRDFLVDTPLTIRNVGEIQEVTLPLDIDSQWDVSELWAFAMVQRNSDKAIYNSGSTFITPYTLNLATDGDQSTYIDGPYTYGTTAVTHTGASPLHTVDISLDTSALPDGWDAYFTLNGEDMTFATVALEPYHAANLNVTLVPGEEGYSGRAVLNLHSHSGEVPDVEVPFVGLRSGADLLIVAGDGSGDYGDDFFGPAVEAAGYSYSLWDWGGTAIDAGTMQNYNTVIWYTGENGPSLRTRDRDEIESYLDSGGNMLFSGQNTADEIVAQGGS